MRNDAALFIALSIALYSYGHWIGGTVALLMVVLGWLTS